MGSHSRFTHTPVHTHDLYQNSTLTVHHAQSPSRSRSTQDDNEGESGSEEEVGDGNDNGEFVAEEEGEDGDDDDDHHHHDEREGSSSSSDSDSEAPKALELLQMMADVAGDFERHGAAGVATYDTMTHLHTVCSTPLKTNDHITHRLCTAAWV